MNHLPIDYLEIGYRNNQSSEYLGRFGYTPISVLRRLRELSNKKLVVMLNEKSVKPDDLINLIKPIKGLVDMIRIAIDPKNFDRAVILAKAVKDIGFEVGFNVMYMSKWETEYKGFLDKLPEINGVADLFCMVDSFGGITPDEVTSIYKTVKTKTSCPIGFHGHNNLQLSLINTLTAIKLGIDYVDATVLGMGRGAGNLNVELLLTYLNSHYGLQLDFNVLGDVIAAFTPLLEKYRWGSNLPYMLAGANRIPQKEVMDLINNRAYSFDSIVRGLQNRVENLKDNAKYPILSPHKYENAVVIGGGNTPLEHLEGIKAFIRSLDSVAVIFATARHSGYFNDIEASRYYCLIGQEAKRLKDNIQSADFRGTCILSPYPRKLGTDVPDFAKESTYELASIDFTERYQDSCTTLAVQSAISMGCQNIYAVGYDGYPGGILSEKEMSLTNENRAIFSDYEKFAGKKIVSLTPTLYQELNVESVYQFI
jgi:4-hydroxy 2-oxovalerate aldolase